MNSYAFFTDSDSDLPFRFVDELELNMVYMPYMVDGKEYFDDLGRNGREKEFFDAMRKGAAPVTSLLPTAAYEEYFEKIPPAEIYRGGHAEHFAATEHSGAEGSRAVPAGQDHGRSGRVAGRKQEPFSGILHSG